MKSHEIHKNKQNQCFSKKILLEGQSGPLKIFLRGQFFRKGANKLKATEGKNASGYQGK